MKITFIRPNFWERHSMGALHPLVFAILAALTPPEHEIRLFDERVEGIDFDHETDLVAMTVETYTARRAYEIAQEFRQRGIPVIMGGYHPTLAPDEAKLYADAVVMGDAEGLWEQILTDACNHQLRPYYSQNQQPALGGIPIDRSIFKEKKYSRLFPVYYGRGCRYACDFCSIHSFYNTQLRHRPIEELVSEIERLDSKFILFIDDNLFVNLQATKEFLRALKPLNIHWACQMSVDIVQDPEILDLMADTGCIAPLIGFESMNKDNLKQMKKGWNLRFGNYASIIKQIRQRGMMVYGTFVLGYDYDTKDSIEATLNFALENKLFLANFNPLTPMPGAKLYARLKEEGRLLYDKWWLDPGYRYGEAAFIPRSMKAEELSEGCYWARTQFNKYSSIFQRGIDFEANAKNLKNFGLYLLANLISRREIHVKQWLSLGKNTNPVPTTEQG